MKDNDQIQVKIVEDSISGKNRLTTFQLRYHRYFHAEVMTHRVFSRNASSSRAIPVKTMLKQVWNDPAIPIYWGANVAGMQAKEELKGWKLSAAQTIWKLAGKAACVFAWGFSKIGLHKQIANRILEPWQFIHVVVSATDWDNFLELRDHPDAQPEIQVLAKKIKLALQENTPRNVEMKLGVAKYHLPYVLENERIIFPLSDLLKISVARCARVSYLKHDGSLPRVSDDIALFERLVGQTPLHASPAEHQAYPNTTGERVKNFQGWVQYRFQLEQEHSNWVDKDKE